MKTKTYGVPSVALRMVRERTVRIPDERINEPLVGARIAHALIGDSGVERLIALVLDGTNRITSVATVSVGGMNGCACTPRDVLRAVLVAHGAAFVLAHNHPSGDPTPSEADVLFTAKMREASAIVGLPMLDHLVVTSSKTDWARVP